MTKAEFTHAIERTSPKGEAFVGKCRYCGKEGITLKDIEEACPGHAKSFSEVLSDIMEETKND